MPACATPGCGNFGRPFAACGICNYRVYCGSSCLKPVKAFQAAELRQRGPDLNIADGNDDATVDICPPCMELFLGAFSPREDTDNEGTAETAQEDTLGQP